jgi:hypothetical protein
LASFCCFFVGMVAAGAGFSALPGDCCFFPFFLGVPASPEACCFLGLAPASGYGFFFVGVDLSSEFLPAAEAFFGLGAALPVCWAEEGAGFTGVGFFPAMSRPPPQQSELPR